MPSSRRTAASAWLRQSSLVFLTVLAAAIFISGAALAIYSAWTGFSISILGTPFNAMILGFMAAWLGLRDLLAVRRLRQDAAMTEGFIPASTTHRPPAGPAGRFSRKH